MRQPVEEELQRQPIEEDQEELQRQAIEEDEVQLAPKSDAVSKPQVDGSCTAVQSVRSGGVPLPDAARQYFEPRFGANLGDVRVHTGEGAAQATAAVRARAFTLGNSIAFAPGQFDTQGTSGRHLLAHELMHVMQQNGGTNPAASKKPSTIQRKELNEDSVENAEPSAVDAAVGMLRDALGQGAAEVERVARQLPLSDVSAALASVPDAILVLLDMLWPDNTGWAAHIKVDGDLNLAGTSVGLPFEVSFDGAGAIDASIMRRGGTISVSIAPSAVGGGAGALSLWQMLEAPLGLHMNGALGLKLLVDLARIKWPTMALDALFALDIKRALSELMWTSLSIGANTQIEIEGGIGGALDLALRAGPTSIISAASKAGGKIGAKVSVITPTEVLPGKIQLSGQFGIFLNFDFKVFGGQDNDPSVIMKSLVSALARSNLAPLFGAGFSGGGDIGLRYALNIPPYGNDAPATNMNWIEVGIFVIGTGGGKLLGQGLDGKGTAEVTFQLPDIPAFVAALDDGVDLGDMELLSLVHGFNASFEVTGVLRNYLELFPMIIDWFPELGMIEDTNYVSVKASATLKATRDQLDAIDERYRNGTIELISRMATGEALEGLRSGADALLENMADVVGFIDKVSFDLAAGTERMFSLDTPAEKDIGGGGIGGEEHISRTYHRDATAEELGFTAIENWLRGLIVDDRESYVPEGPRKPYVPDRPRERYGPRRPDGATTMIANTQNVRMVSNPKHWYDDHVLVKRLPKGTPVTLVHKGLEKPFNRTAPEFQWWFVRAGEERGWVMQVLLDGASQAMQ
ncbi:MAG: DUF4157 domain-containing protein [Candidatus Thiodiazotropha sp. (ex Lucinoma borealis)]|nr:DUF4157 domain-containing protein [Candidatus Thiodiazotropha sp. (ex Lucinoma borealis)]